MVRYIYIYIDFTKKYILDNVRGNLYYPANIERLRRNIVHIIC
jgi:hypothetical protein